MNFREPRGENSRAPKMQLGQGWQRPSGMAKTVYERENCGGGSKFQSVGGVGGCGACPLPPLLNRNPTNYCNRAKL